MIAYLQSEQEVSRRGAPPRVQFFARPLFAILEKEDSMINVNGKQVEMAGETNLDEFVLSLGYKAERIAVELNGKIVPRAKYKNIMLKENDTLEVVNFMGGG